jgi:hypothetical protein
LQYATANTLTNTLLTTPQKYAQCLYSLPILKSNFTDQELLLQRSFCLVGPCTKRGLSGTFILVFKQKATSDCTIT